MTRFDDEKAWKDKHNERLAQHFADKMLAIIEPVIAKMSPEEQERSCAAFEKRVDEIIARRSGH